jgi:branched-chain amino acid transport system ATP-binding protein
VTPLLEVEGLRAGYGQLEVLEGIDFAVDSGQKVVILGPNGAGKTTTLRALSGMVHTSGRIAFDGGSLAGVRTAEIARRGVAHVPEGRGTLPELTVQENLRLGAYVRRDGAAVKEDLGRCYGWFPRLEERRSQSAGNLSGGELQMLATARALMLRPRLLMLDEPSLGLAPIVTRELYRVLGEICDEQGMTVLLVEQNAGLALDFADYAYVLESGRIALSGAAQDVKDNDDVRRSYLGF